MEPAWGWAEGQRILRQQERLRLGLFPFLESGGGTESLLWVHRDLPCITQKVGDQKKPSGPAFFLLESSTTDPVLSPPNSEHTFTISKSGESLGTQPREQQQRNPKSQSQESDR